MKNDRDFRGKPSKPESDLPDTESLSEDMQEELYFLIGMLRNMPDREPPRNLTETVLRPLKPKRISTWHRLYLWVSTPRSINITPIRLIPAAAAISVALLLTIHFFPKHESHMEMDQGEQTLVSVTFTFNYPQARSVSLLGSFNQWKPGGLAMRSASEKKVWVLELQLPEGRHEYAFLVDGNVVVPDPKARFSQDDGFGNKNSILFATKADEQHI
jgi:hypothetical protein